MSPFRLLNTILLFLSLLVPNPMHLITLLFSPILYLANFFCRMHRRFRAGGWDPIGKVVLITGASSGIGEALAYEYAKRGAKLVLAARRTEELNKVGEECRRLGAKDVMNVVTDVGDDSQIKNLIDQVKTKYTHLDALYLNAGVSMGTPFASFTNLEAFHKLMQINFFGCITLTHHALPLLLDTPKSRIIVTSSVVGLTGPPTRTGYSATKFALRGFYESLGAELWDKDVYVTVVYPGAVRTDINRTRLGDNPDMLPLDNAMSAEECARIMLKATCDGAKEVVMTNKFKLGRVLEGMVPDLWAALVRSNAKKMLDDKKRS